MAKMHIDGDWADALSGETYEVNNPATGQAIDSVPHGSEEDVQAAVKAAEQAASAWAETAPDERASLLRKGIQAIEAQSKDLAASLTVNPSGI